MAADDERARNCRRALWYLPSAVSVSSGSASFKNARAMRNAPPRVSRVGPSALCTRRGALLKAPRYSWATDLTLEYALFPPSFRKVGCKSRRIYASQRRTSHRMIDGRSIFSRLHARADTWPRLQNYDFSVFCHHPIVHTSFHGEQKRSKPHVGIKNLM